MNTSGGYEGEMDDVGGLSEASIDRLLAGRAPADEDTIGLGKFAEDLRSLYVAPPRAAVQERHLTAIADAVRLHNNQPQQPAPKAHGRARLAALLPAWRRNVVLSGFFGSLTAKVLVGTVAVAAATGGLAAGNLLPTPVQDAVSDIAGTVGIALPHGGETVSPSIVPVDHAEQATRILDALLKQVSDAAAQPHAVGLPVAEAAQACASQVSTIASELADSAKADMDPTQALSLAQRATAIAQEAVGCALPKPTDAGKAADTITSGSAGDTTGATAAQARVVSATTGAKPIVDAATDCVASLKPGIMELARWWTAKMNPAAASALASKAGLLAGSASDCASKVGTAAQTAFTFPMPIPNMSKLPVTVPGRGLWPMAPAPAAAPDASGGQGSTPEPAQHPQPAPAPLPAGAPAPAMTPSWWSAFMPGTTPGTGQTGQTNPAAPWAGMTGSWGNLGQWMPSGPWNPFQPAPQPAPTATH